MLAVTIWNKEEPPKSVLKLYATMAAASRALDGDKMADSFFVASSYLSTATVLYKRGGFTADEIDKLRKHTHDMSFDEIYSPGFFYDGSQTDRTLDGYVAQFFSAPHQRAAELRQDRPRRRSDRAAPIRRRADDGARRAAGRQADEGVLPSTVMGRLAWHTLVNGGWPEIANALRLQHAQAHQRRALFRRLCEDQGPAGRCCSIPTGSSRCRTNGAIC